MGKGLQYRPGKDGHEVKKVFYSPFNRKVQTDSAREHIWNVLKPHLSGHGEKSFSTELLDRSKWGKEMGHNHYRHHHLVFAPLDET